MDDYETKKQEIKKKLPPELLAKIAIFAEAGAVNGDFLTGDGFWAGAVSQHFLLHSHCPDWVN